MKQIVFMVIRTGQKLICIKTTSGAAVLIWCVKIYNILMTFPCLAPVANIKLEDREKSFNNTIKS